MTSRPLPAWARSGLGRWLLVTYRFAYRIITRVRGWVLRPLALAYLSLEYCFLVVKNGGLKDLRGADVTYPLWFWSFGHQISDLHILAMRFCEKNLLVFISDYGNYSHELVDTFQGIVPMRFLRHTRLARWCWERLGTERVKRLKRRLLRFLVRVAGSTATIEEEYHETFGPIISGIFQREYYGLMHGEKNIVLEAPKRHIDAFRAVRDQSHPELKNAWHVALYLRRKEANRSDVRDTAVEPYRAVIERIVEKGGVVFCGGDYDPHEIFPGTKGVYGYNDFPCSRTLSDLFFMTQSRFMVGPHSGPTALSSAFDIPKLIADCPFMFLAGLREKQISLYRSFRARDGHVLSTREMFSFPVVGMSDTEHYRAAGLTVIPNTEEQLLAGLDEMLQRFVDGKPWTLTSDDENRLCQFRALLPGDAVAAWSVSRPALSWLRSQQFS